MGNMAARGNQDPPTYLSLGDEIGQNKANCHGCGGDGIARYDYADRSFPVYGFWSF